jgi:transposase InsO family protein
VKKVIIGITLWQKTSLNRLKQNLCIIKGYNTRKQAELALFDYIENWCNRQRRHSALDGMTILEFKKLNYKKKRLDIP